MILSNNTRESEIDMTSLNRHTVMVSQSQHDAKKKDKLIELMTRIWTELALAGQPSTISSSVGGQHKTTSKHYRCEAFDINPDKGYTAEYYMALQRAVDTCKKMGVRVLIEFNNSEPNVRRSYRCTHIEFNKQKQGIFALDYASNTSGPVVI